jgi:hypothetical protein
MTHGHEQAAPSPWRVDMSRESVWKRACFIACTIFALFLGIVIMFFFLESSTASADALADHSNSSSSNTDAKQTANSALFLDRLFSLVRLAPLVEQLRFLTALPHTAGSARDNLTAVHTASLWQQYGLANVEIEALDVLLSMPVRSAVTVRLAFANGSVDDVSLRLNESVRPQVPENPVTWNAYSGSGVVTAKVVYCHYGRHEDFERVKASVPGNVALVRYGRSFRGNKVHNAEMFGAVGVLIYSDPADDGPVPDKNELAYPDGPWRAPDSVQRGSLFPSFGDPLTPGFGAEVGADVPRLDPATLRTNPKAPWMPSVPVMPLSFNDARVLLTNLEGEALFNGTEWKLGATSAVQATVDVQMDESIRRIWNVIGRIDGTEDDSPVILGNHRDAWTYGAVDPNTGSTVLNEVVRSFATLHASGWRPRRTLLFCSWDAEEFGLIGSTEFVERRRTELGRNAVAYLNVDEATAGHTRLSVQAVPSMAAVVREVAARVPYRAPSGTMRSPEEAISYAKHKSLLAFWNASQAISQNYGPVKGAKLPSTELIGSGSDFVGFLQVLGVPSISLSFQFERTYGAYHSNDDNFDWVTRFGDPGFSRQFMMTQLWAGVAMRLADERVLPFDFVEYASDLRRYVADAQAYGLAATNGTIRADHVVWGPLTRATDAFERAATSVTRLQTISVNLTDSAVAAFNRRLLTAERAFLDRREPFHVMRHILFRPSLDNAYLGVPLPSVYTAFNSFAASGGNASALATLAFEIAANAVSIDEAAALLRPRLLKD